jgi:hypothetical protein
VRDVLPSELARAAVRKATEKLPAFEQVFVRGIIWMLERVEAIESERIPGTDPPIFVIETTAWRTEGIPRMRITYRELKRGHAIELLSVTLYEPTPPAGRR